MSISRRRCSIPCAPRPPAASSTCRATRAIASSAASIRISCAPGLEAATRLILELCGGEPSAVAQCGRGARTGAGRSPFGPAAPKPRRDRDRRRTSSAASSKRLGATVRKTTRPGRSSRRRGAATSRARPISSRKCCAFTATSIFRRCRSPREPALPKPALDPAQRRAGFVRRSLAARGLIEAVTYSFMPPAQAGSSAAAADALRARQSDQRRSRRDAAVAAAQPFGGGAAQCRSRVRRQRALRGRARNTATTRPRARTSSRPACAPAAPASSAGTIPGGRSMRFMAKADALAALAAPGLPATAFRSAADPPAWYHPGRAGRLRLGPKLLGWFGEIHPGVLAEFGREGRGGRVRGLPRRRAAAARRAAARGRCSSSRRSSRWSATSPSSCRPGAAGRDAAARRARRRQEADRRGAALRCLYRARAARGQEVARHHRRACSPRKRPSPTRHSTASPSGSSPRSKRRPAAPCGNSGSPMVAFAKIRKARSPATARPSSRRACPR